MQSKYKRMLKGMALKEEAASKRRLKRDWLVYVLCCNDGSFYTGITNNLEKRLKVHNDGTGARYTRLRRPVVLIYQENRMTRSQALTRECEIKAMSRPKKEALVKTQDTGNEAATPHSRLTSKKGKKNSVEPGN